MYIVKTQQCFDSAHFLAGYDGKCRNLHGHRWTVSVEIGADSLDEGGMVVDFKDLKAILKEKTEELDHALIIEKDSLRKKTYEALIEEEFRIIEVDFRPTAENFSRYFFEWLAEKGFAVEAVEVYETPNNCARYQRRMRGGI